MLLWVGCKPPLDESGETAETAESADTVDTTDSTVSNAPPVLSDIESTPASYSLGGSPVGITSSLVVSDADDTDLVSATLTISSGYQEGFDTLVLTSRPVNIGGSFDAPSGVYTLSGTSSLGMYQSAIRSMTYDNSGGVGVNSASRVVTIVVNDGEDDSVSQSRTIEISAR